MLVCFFIIDYHGIASKSSKINLRSWEQEKNGWNWKEDGLCASIQSRLNWFYSVHQCQCGHFEFYILFSALNVKAKFHPSTSFSLVIFQTAFPIPTSNVVKQEFNDTFTSADIHCFLCYYNIPFIAKKNKMCILNTQRRKNVWLKEIQN